MTAPVATFNLSAPISAVSGPIAVGDVLVPIGPAFYKATTANLAAAGVRAQGVAMTAWSSPTPGAVLAQSVGFVDAASTNLGAGAASWVRVSAAGILERVTTPSGADDVVGFCSTDGTMGALFGVLTPTLVNGGASYVTPTGTGIPHIVGGVQQAASSLIVNADVSASAAIAANKVVQATGTGIPHVVGGALSAASSLIVDADVSASAAIAVSKFAPGTNTFVLTTTGGVAVWAAASGGGASAGGSGQVQTSDGAGAFTAPSNVKAGANYMSVGATPAATGQIRLTGTGSTTVIVVRNASNTGDLSMAGSDGTFMYFGDVSRNDSGMNLYTGGGIVMNATTDITLGLTAYAHFSSTDATMGAPVTGLASASSPWSGMNGMFVKSMSGSTYDLAASEYAMTVLKVTGTGTNVIRVPTATDAQAFLKYVWNAGSGTLQLKDTSNHASAFVALPAGNGAWFLVANGVVIQLTAALPSVA